MRPVLFKNKRLPLVALTITFSSLFGRYLHAQLPAGKPFTFLAWAEPFYKYRNDGKPGRAVSFVLKEASYRGPATVKVICSGITGTTAFTVKDSVNRGSVLLPAGVGVEASAMATVTVTAGSKEWSDSFVVPAKKQWTVYIYPHSHVDIGYTALPAEVEKIHLRNIDVGIDLAKKTQHYPEGSRFVWNTEATWVAMHYWKKASPAQKQTFIEAVQKGWVKIDGGHSNVNTSTCSDEELLRFFDNAKALEKTTNVLITTMVQMDVPGVAWGLVQAAGQYGIEGFINFPNYFDLRKQWEHKPFYWLAPDGKNKMLFLQGFPYGIGYTIKGNKYGLAKLQSFSKEYDRVRTETPLKNFLDPFIFNETTRLEGAGSPYDLFAMTWSMADNCVIDADLPEAVKQWNENYAYPKLIISGAKEILDDYEKKYTSIIPTYSGDFTEFWTNGLGANAAAVGAGRRAKETLVQAEILWSLLQAKATPTERISQAWENILLSAEHTWGAQDSKSSLAQKVEALKASYFSDAEAESKALIEEALLPYRDTTVSSFSVVNTLSWERSGTVTLTATQSRFGDKMIDERGRLVPSQRLSNGTLIFEAQAVPAFGSKQYRLVNRKQPSGPPLFSSQTTLSNDVLSLRINPQNGTISSVKNLQDGYEYVDSAVGLNAYQYVKGVYNGKDHPQPPTTDSVISIRVKEAGSLLSSVVVTSKGEGVNNFIREIRLYNHSSTIEISNTLDKISTTSKEGIHFAFGFHLPDAVNRIDMPWATVQPNTQQLNGANKNWSAAQRWVDVSNSQHGITWSATEAPLIEWGYPSGNILDGARQYSLWQREVPSSQTLYSWPLNNHWDTNFPLEQGGIIQQHYAVNFHKAYDAVAAARFGMEAQRPLLVVQSKKAVIAKPLLAIDNPNLMVSTLKRTADGKALLLRVKSISDKPERLTLSWPNGKPKAVVESTVDEEQGHEVQGSLEVPPYGMANLRLQF